MKKLLIIITLFVSSFFLFCNKEVKAAEYTYDFSGQEQYINNDIYPLIKSKAIELLISNPDLYNKFIICYYSNKYYIYLFNTDVNPYIMLKDSYFIYDHGYSYTTYNSSDGINYSKKDLSYFSQKKSSEYYFLYNSSLLDVGSFDKITLKLNDYTYEVLSSEEFIFLEDLYNKSLNVEQENPHQEEIDKVTNFYTMVIEKISYLAEQIANNYILLSIIGIFIVTFVFLLIFRRFL